MSVYCIIHIDGMPLLLLLLCSLWSGVECCFFLWHAFFGGFDSSMSDKAAGWSKATSLASSTKYIAHKIHTIQFTIPLRWKLCLYPADFVQFARGVCEKNSIIIISPKTAQRTRRLLLPRRFSGSPHHHRRHSTFSVLLFPLRKLSVRDP